MNKVELKTGYIKSFDGTKIYYEVRGSGYPVVFYYGIGCLMNHWAPQIKYFSQNYQTIIFDYRAHHKSEIPTDRSKIDVESIARDSKVLLDHLQIEKACLVGHSFGCQVLMESYKRFPHLISGLVFVNGFASNPIQGMFGNDFATKAFDIIRAGFSLAPETITHLWKKSVSNPLAIQLSALAGGFNINLTALKDIEIYAKGIANIDLHSFITLFENMMKYDGRPHFSEVLAPTLIISGEKDSVTPMKYQEDMHSMIKNSELLVVPYGSHCTQLDMPDFVNLKIDQLLQRLSQEHSTERTEVQI